MVFMEGRRRKAPFLVDSAKVVLGSVYIANLHLWENNFCFSCVSNKRREARLQAKMSTRCSMCNEIEALELYATWESA